MQDELELLLIHLTLQTEAILYSELSQQYDEVEDEWQDKVDSQLMLTELMDEVDEEDYGGHLDELGQHRNDTLAEQGEALVIILEVVDDELEQSELLEALEAQDEFESKMIFPGLQHITLEEDEVEATEPGEMVAIDDDEIDEAEIHQQERMELIDLDDDEDEAVDL